MRLTKLGHSCVRLEKDGEVLVLDPGVWSGDDALDGADALLITHEHVDHLAEPVVRAALDRNRGLGLWTTAPVADQIAGYGSRVHTVGEGDAFTAAGFEVGVIGQRHAQIHPDFPVTPNVGFLIDGTVFHPGDAFTVPGQKVPVLLVPISGPWLKTAEMIDFMRRSARSAVTRSMTNW